MITASNYLEQSINVDWSTMPAVLKKGKPDVDNAIEFYNDDDDIKETIDIFLKQVNDNLPKKSKEKKVSNPGPKKTAPKAAVNKNLNKLQKLCDVVNNRKAKGLNDDDQVGRMFAFENTIDDARVIIGYDDYQAMSVADLKTAYKTSSEKTDKAFFFRLAGDRYKCNLPIVKTETKPKVKPKVNPKNNTEVNKELSQNDETIYVDFLNKDKGFIQDRKHFKGDNAYENAVKWGKENFENFNLDMIQYEELTTEISKEQQIPCEEKLKDLKKEVTKKPRKPRAKKTLASEMRDTTVDAYKKEYVLVRRFYNMIGKKYTTFRKIQLLYMAYQKAILTKEVSKANARNPLLFNTINEKVAKLYKAAVNLGDAAAKEINIGNEVLLSQMIKLMETTTLNPAVTLSKSYVNLDKQPEVKKVERLLKRFDKAIDNKIIDKDNRLWKVIKHDRQALIDYLEDPKDEIPVKVYGLAAPKMQPIKEFTFPRSVKKKVETKGMAAIPVLIQEPLLEKELDFIIRSVEEEAINQMPVIESNVVDQHSLFNESVKKVANEDVLKKPSVKEVDLRNLGFTKAVDAPDTPDGLFRLPGAIGEFLQDLQSYQALILIKGTKHTSKSQLAMQIANALGESGKKVGYIDYEQGGVNSKDTIDSLSWNTTPEGKQNIHIKGELENPMEELRSFCQHFFAIVADSVTDLGIKPDQLSQLRKEFPNCLWIFISQVKENGAMYGGNKMAHNPTVIIECFPHEDPKFRYATLEKNRGNKLNKYYSMYYKKLIPNPNDVPIEELEDKEIIKTVYL